jgi:hypothetical protein
MRALNRILRHSVKYVCGALNRAPVSEAAYPRASAPASVASLTFAYLRLHETL